MDKILKYKAIIKELMEDRIAYPNEYYPHYKDLLVIDEVQNQYIHIFTGWRKGEYFYDILIHLAIEAGKVIIYENNTDVPIHDCLIAAGISAADIRVQSQIPLEVV